MHLHYSWAKEKDKGRLIELHKGKLADCIYASVCLSASCRLTNMNFFKIL
jgi:hypothetical protein